MKSTQLHIDQTSSDELTKSILDGVDSKLEQFFEKYKTIKSNNEEELLTVDETLGLLKCSKQALWNWRKKGILPSYRLGNRVYYKKSDIYDKLVKQS
ncbi:MAG: helix-turn-helix domain-containing protein [Winogradskyella sp.]|nr:helix-turn-helix domain-containing protein [Winogradskyella sp.]